MVDIEVFKNFPKDILIDIIDIKHCILEEKGDIDSISKQIWEGSRSIFSGIMKWGFLKSVFENSECDGMKDILYHWDRKNVQTLIFYLPTNTVQEIRRKLGGRVNPKEIISKIENSIITYSKENLPDLYICNLKDKSSGLEDIFNISTLKREFDKDTREHGESIYLLGLKYNLDSRATAFYINNRPVKQEGGFILGNSPLLKHRLKKGFININVYGTDIELDFNHTDSFFSQNMTVNENLQYVNFSSDVAGNLFMDIPKANQPIILESQRDKSKLYFSKEKLSNIEEEEEEILSEPSVDRESELYMESFFIPRDKELKKVNLLLIEKNNQTILAGGQYRDNLSCNILAEVIVNLMNQDITVKNRSHSDLIFSDFDMFWKLSKSNIISNSKTEEEEVITDFNVTSYNANSTPVTGIGDITDYENDNNSTIERRDYNQTIKKSESFSFKINEIQFNDSYISFDTNGILIGYNDFNVTNFKNEFAINRMNPKMSIDGTIIDCFIKLISRGKFESGGKIYDSHSDILGRAISSKPINLKQIGNGLEIESKLDPRSYVVQISTNLKQYILGEREKKVIINSSELKNITIEVVNKRYIKKPLLKFRLKFNSIN